MSTCNARVGANTITFACSLVSGHAGPHYAIENGVSVRKRQRWEAEQAHQASGLGQFQGVAQTTAERYTDNATEVPQSPAIQRQDAEKARAMEAALAAVAASRQAVAASRQAQVEPAQPSLDRLLFADAHIRIMDSPTGQVTLEDLTTGGIKQLDLRPMESDEAAPTKQRPGDQVLPTVNSHQDSYTTLIADLDARRKVGVQRYGIALQPFNDRSTLQDAYEEATDLTVYLRSLLTMQADTRVALIREITEVINSVDGIRMRPGFNEHLADKITTRILDMFAGQQSVERS